MRQLCAAVMVFVLLMVGVGCGSDTTEQEFNEETCIAMAYERLSDLLPSAPMYIVSEYEVNEDLSDERAYIVRFAIPIGEYVFGNEATVYFTKNGELAGVDLPSSSRYERIDAQTKRRLIQALPSRDEVPALLKAQMDGIYGEDNYTILDTGTPVVGKHGDGYALSCTVDIKTAMGWEELASFVYELN